MGGGGYFSDINLFKANAEGEEKSLLEQDHQHVIWVESAAEMIFDGFLRIFS